MYCPRCAAQNLDDAKFCRACGTGLETVALALSGRLSETAINGAPTPASWIEERKKGLQHIVKASGLLGSSLLFGVALRLFSGQQSEWIFVWLVFAGWMACWGVISLISGITSLIEARYLQKQIQLNPGYFATTSVVGDKSTNELSPAGLPLPLSVTEHTTKSLSKKRPESE